MITMRLQSSNHEGSLIYKTISRRELPDRVSRLSETTWMLQKSSCTQRRYKAYTSSKPESSKSFPDALLEIVSCVPQHCILIKQPPASAARQRHEFQSTLGRTPRSCTPKNMQKYRSFSIHCPELTGCRTATPSL